MLKQLSTIAVLAIALCVAGCDNPVAEGRSDTKRAIEAQFPTNAFTMLAIANCESRLRQFDEHGAVVLGMEHRADSGLFQINKAVHADKAKELGADLDTTQGNIKFAHYLYEKFGTQPWKSSKKCWGSKLRTASQ